MPIYATKCMVCGTLEDVFLKLSEYENLPECCGEMRVRVITPVNVMADIQPYRSMATGEYIGGRAQHKAHLKANGLVELGNESVEQKEITRTKRQEFEDKRNLHQLMEAKGL